MQTINMGNSGTGATTIKISGGTDAVQVNLPLKDSTGANIVSVPSASNCMIGKNVMPAFTTGTANIAFGDNVAVAPVSAVANTFVGSEVARYATDNISWNTGVGNRSLVNVKSNNNTALGHGSLHMLTTGGSNVGIGVNTGDLTTGSNCTFIGSNSKAISNAQLNATALGSGAIVDADNTIQLGNSSITAVKTSGTLTAAGLESTGTTLNIASQNNTNTVNIGSGTGVQTINMGNNGTGTTTIKLGGGTDAVQVNLPLKNTAGANILNVAANANILVGLGISQNGGGGNTLIGNAVAGVMEATGVWNTGVGAQALSAITTGTRNVALGHNTLAGLTTGENNIGIGLRAGFETNDVTKTLTTGSRNTLIGSDTRTATSTMVNSTALGYGAITDADNTIQLGNTFVTAVKTSGTLVAAGLMSSAWKIPDVKGAWIGWNQDPALAAGRTTFANHQGGGIGGWNWMNYNDSGLTKPDPQMTLDRNGILYVGSNVVTVAVPTAPTHLTNKAYVDSKVANQNLNTTDIVTFGGLKLPTIGGTASTLDCYEEYDMSTAWTETNMATNNIRIVRVGKMVTLCHKVSLSISNLPASANKTILSSVAVPARFCPSYMVSCPIFVYIHSQGTYSLAAFEIDSSSGTNIRIRGMTTPFQDGNQISIERFSVSWSL